MKIKFLPLFALLILFTTSCSYKKHVENKEAELEVLSNYIKTKGYPDSLTSQNGLKYAVKQKSGLYYVEEKLGKGKVITSASLVSIRFSIHNIANDTVVLYSNAKFDDPFYADISLYTSNNFPANSNGFFEGLNLMREGGTSWFIFPSTLGYGKYGGSIGTFSYGGYYTFLYRVTVTDVQYK